MLSFIDAGNRFAHFVRYAQIVRARALWFWDVFSSLTLRADIV
jgi:hypothetical protein